MTKPEPLPALLVEAFSEQPLQGNGAGVVLLSRAAERSWMQAVAARLNQSETAFLLPWQDSWALRWFTPSCEVPLCGHGTLAALVGLSHWGKLEPAQALQLLTRSGPLTVERDRDGSGGSLELPAPPLEAAEPSTALLTLLEHRLASRPERAWSSSIGYRVVLLPASADLAGMASIARELEGEDRRGLVLMQPMPSDTERIVLGQPADYQLRFFAPGLGIDEDPVTGSAHALVAPYWQERLGKAAVVGWQCAPRGGGLLCDRGSLGMIRLRGGGHLLWEGTLQAGGVSDDRSGWQLWLSGA